jgi:Response regulators consisting of a CheY-like receiver domain and a winged-helix DNA-binding domain
VAGLGHPPSIPHANPGVEDERPIAEFIQRGLEAEGYSVACAFDGEEGLALARSGDYALVVLDVLLPKLSGLEVVRGIRETDETLPVIMLTPWPRPTMSSPGSTSAPATT